MTDKQLKPSHTAQEFAARYDALCQEMGYVIAATPKLVPTNHGTFELAVDLVAVKQPQQGE